MDPALPLRAGSFGKLVVLHQPRLFGGSCPAKRDEDASLVLHVAHLEASSVKGNGDVVKENRLTEGEICLPLHHG